MGLLDRKFKQVKKEEEKIRSIDLVEQINVFRKMEGKRSVLKHKHLMDKIKEYNETADRLGGPKIRTAKYTDKQNKKRVCYLLTDTQAKLFMAKESYTCFILMEKEFDKLKLENNIMKASIDHTKETHDKIKDLIDTLELSSNKYMMINNEINDIVSKKYNIENLKKEDMNSEQLEFRAVVEEFYIQTINENKKHGGTKKSAKNHFKV